MTVEGFSEQQTWLITAAAAVVMLGVMLRRRHGNVYRRLTDWFERRTGWTTATVLRTLAVATLLGWAAIYLIFGTGGEETGLESLLPGLFEDSTEPAPGSAPE